MSGEGRLSGRKIEVKGIVDDALQLMRSPRVDAANLEESVRITAADALDIPSENVSVITEGARMTVRVRIPCPDYVRVRFTGAGWLETLDGVEATP
jgi:hypothetical protein